MPMPTSRNVAEAQARGLALIVGLNVRYGGTPTLTAMSPTEVQTFGSALLSSTYPCAFISWQYTTSVMSAPGIGAAMQVLSSKAKSRPDEVLPRRLTLPEAMRGRGRPRPRFFLGINPASPPAAAEEDDGDGLEHDAQVFAQALAADVLEVVADLGADVVDASGRSGG